jgi:sugar phosphate isomerase/epimerase
VDWDNFDAAVDGCRAMGLDTICHGGFGEDTTLDEVKAEAERINAGIDKLEALGMSMFMHNHCGEFEATFDGRPLFDVVMELCPKLRTEFDVYWAQAAGADPVAVVRQYAGRMPMIHLRDGPVEPKTPQVPLGQGAVDIVGCVKATDPAVLKWAIVELCQVEGDMLDALAQSYDFLIGQGLVGKA